MATKSSNTYGNPWHDDKGQFTSKNGADMSNDNLLEIFNIESNDFDENDASMWLDVFDEDTDIAIEFKQSLNVDEAMELADKLIGSKIAFYDKNDLEYANCMNEALFKVHKKYSKIFDDIHFFGNTEECLSMTINFIGDLQKKLCGELGKYLFEKQMKNMKWDVGGDKGTGAITISSANWPGSAIVMNPFNKKVTIGCDFSSQIHKNLKNDVKLMYPIYHEMGHLCSAFLKKRNKINEIHKIRANMLVHREDYDFTWYAIHGPIDEFFSEAFADVMCFGENAREKNKQVVALWDKLYEESTK